MTQSTDTPLADFLLARLAEDEVESRHLDDCRLVSIGIDHGWCDCGSAGRVRADVDAKRRIVTHYHGAVKARNGMADPISRVLGDTIVETCEEFLRLLALPYADHPDYRQEWTP